MIASVWLWVRHGLPSKLLERGSPRVAGQQVFEVDAANLAEAERYYRESLKDEPDTGAAGISPAERRARLDAFASIRDAKERVRPAVAATKGV